MAGCRSCGSDLPAVSLELGTRFCGSCRSRKQDADSKQRLETLKWFRKRAEQGDHQAQCYLGMLYATGLAIPKDKVQAHSWFDLAASGGDKQASVKRRIIAETMTTEQIAEAECLALAWGNSLHEDESLDADHESEQAACG